MQRELIEGLIRLADFSNYMNEGSKADVLAERFHLVENPFDYFLQCLSITRGLQSEYGSENCPSDTEIISNILWEAAGTLPGQWHHHKQECHACQHRVEVFGHLVRNIWRVLNDHEQYLLANIILAYLRGDSSKEIEGIFKGLEEHLEEEDGYMRFLKGILIVNELDDSGSMKNCWYGLVRRETTFIGSTRCFMSPLGEGSPIFRVDIDNDRERFYFMLFGGVQVEGGLKFYLSPNADNLVLQPDSLDFAQQMRGVRLMDGRIDQKNWQAVFYGRVSSLSIDLENEFELRCRYE